MEDSDYFIKSNLQFYLILSFITIIFSFSSGLYAQDLTLASTVTVEEVFQIIEKQSDYSIFYRNNQIDVTKEVSVNTKQENINQILDDVLQGTGLTYKYVDDHIVIIPESEKAICELISRQLPDVCQKVEAGKALSDEDLYAIVPLAKMAVGSGERKL